MLLNSNRVIDLLENYRICRLSGRQSGSKTSLAVRLAIELKERGMVKYIVSNMPLVIADDIEEIHLDEKGEASTVFILDEAGAFMGNYEAAQISNALAKMNIYFLLPTFEDPSRKLNYLDIQRLHTWSSVGIPLWEYVAVLSLGRQKDECKFYWFRPAEIFGLYSRKAYVRNDKKVVAKFQDLLNELEKRFDPDGEGYVSEYAKPDGPDWIKTIERTADDMHNSVREMEGLGRELEDILAKTKKRRK